MDTIVFNFYRFILLPLLYALARVLSLLNSLLNLRSKLFENIRFRLKNEFHYRPTFNPDHRSIGVHAASGEIEYAYPIIRKIKETYPGHNIVVTLSSTSVLKAVMNQPDVDAVGPAPIDLFWLVNRFLKKFNFKIFLFARTDVWPEISLQLKQRGTPTYLFSATFSESSAHKGHLLNSLTCTSLNNLNKIMTVTDADKKNFEFIGVKIPILTMGDTRYDQVFFKKQNTKKDLPKLVTGKKVFVAGSTWPEDEAVLLPAFAKLKSTWNLVIAPHELNDATLARIEDFCINNNLKSTRFSKLKNLTENERAQWDVLIVDQYGFLFHLYSWAHLTFVGGSFKSKVHSVMEPLSFFKPVCVGPFHTNNREAIEFSHIPMPGLISTWVQPLKDSAQLELFLETHSKITDSERALLTVSLTTLMSDRQNSTLSTFNEIQVPN
jgi:3-deoxy-D-manno-octulosonic-acid transferase